MIDPDTNALLLLYDDAQAIYKKKSSLGFSLASVGIQAQGRTSILRLNYRNTREILDLACRFAHKFFTLASSSDELALVEPEPEAAGASGPKPQIHCLGHWRDEVEQCLVCLQNWRNQGLAWREMAVIYVAGYQGKAISEQLRRLTIPHL